jgi:hypothetical protein
MAPFQIHQPLLRREAAVRLFDLAATDGWADGCSDPFAAAALALLARD